MWKRSVVTSAAHGLLQTRACVEDGVFGCAASVSLRLDHTAPAERATLPVRCTQHNWSPDGPELTRRPVRPSARQPDFCRARQEPAGLAFCQKARIVDLQGVRRSRKCRSSEPHATHWSVPDCGYLPVGPLATSRPYSCALDRTDDRDSFILRVPADSRRSKGHASAVHGLH